MADLKPGPELDALIAEKVMGIDVIKEKYDDGKYYQITRLNDEFQGEICSVITAYSTTWEGMGLVVEKLDNLGKEGIRWWKLEKGPTGKYHIMLRDYAQNGEISYMAEVDTAPHAICLAALKAVE